MLVSCSRSLDEFYRPMKYYIKQTIDKLREIEAGFPCVTINYGHKSLVLFSRTSTSERPSTIDFTEAACTGYAGPKALVHKLYTQYMAGELVVDEFGDARTIAQIRAMVMDSYALVNTGDSHMGTKFTECVGPIRSLVDYDDYADPVPAVPVPAARPNAPHAKKNEEYHAELPD